MSLKKNNDMRAKLLLSPMLEDAEAKLHNNPEDPEAWYGYAIALGKNDQFEQSIDAFSQGLVRFPFNPLLYFGRGRKNIASKCYWRALADLTMAIRLDPEVYSFWYYRAVVNNLSQNYVEAITDFYHAIQQTEPFERYGLIDWLFVTHVEMGDMKGARAVLDEIPDNLKPPKMHYAYYRRVHMYKGLLKPEDLVDRADIEAHCVSQENRVELEISTLLFGLYIYYIYLGDQQKANDALYQLLEHPYPGAFSTVKGEAAARARGLIK